MIQTIADGKFVDGRRFLRATVGAIAAAALTGTAAWFGLRGVMPGDQTGVATQIVVAVVYGTLISSFAYAFRPAHDFPLDVKFTSAKHLGLAVLAWCGLVSTALAVYLLLSPVTGGISESARQVLNVATDVMRLKGQSAAAWAVAIARGCLIVPVFEELFFRGLMLGWLQKHLADRGTIVVSAVVFAAMHGYPIVLP